MQNLVPDALRGCSIDDFLARLQDYDSEMRALYEKAAAEGRKLRYIARLGADGSAVVGLEAVDADHPFSNINLTDNIVL